MNNPGFATVDCKKLNLLAESSQTISGLYDSVKAAYGTGKEIIATNTEYGVGVPVSPFPVFVIIEAGVYILTSSILQVRVDPEDSVTIYNLVTDFN